MKKILITGLISSALLVSGCDFRKKNTEAAAPEQLKDWSCTAQANIDQIQAHIKDDYLSQLDQSLRQSGFEADQDLLDKIRKSIKFEISHISTKTENPEQSKTLDCSSLITAVLPKGLQKRAENAYLAQPCDECEEGMDSSYTLQDHIKSEWNALTLKNDKIDGIDFKYHLERSDSDEISMTVEEHKIIGLASAISEMAVNYASYEQRSKENQDANQQYAAEENANNAQQMALAQKAMDVRQRELENDKKAAVERLNMTWDRFNEEQKAAQQQDQSDWFEKRDVDCKVLSQKSVHSLDERELETYQKQANYWDSAMEKQNQQMQYSKCFIQKTKERTIYLNNIYN